MISFFIFEFPKTETMKKNTLLISGIILLSAFASNCLKAQIHISQSDMPGVGSKAVMAVDNSGSLSPQGKGSQTWNYNTAGNTQTNQYVFVNPSTTNYYPYFHSSNLADTLIFANGYTYFSSTGTAFSAIGFGEVADGLSLAITLHPWFEQISLPATLGAMDGGASRGDTTVAYHYAFFDSARGVVNIHYADTIDAYGSMTTPFGTQNVIRQKHYDLTIDSLFVHTIGIGWTLYQATATKDYVYRWYANGIGYYFAVMQMDHTNIHDSTFQWFDGTDAGINGISNAAALTSIYPNPCKAQITFSCSSTEARQVSIFDITGRQIATREIKNNILTMNTSDYSTGMYFYRVSDISGNVLDRGKFIVQ